MAKRKFTEEDLGLIVWGDMEGFSTVENKIIDTSRWHTHHTLIFKEDATGKLYRLHWCQGSTEVQDDGPEFSETELSEVEAYEKTVTDYREVN